MWVLSFIIHVCIVYCAAACVLRSQRVVSTDLMEELEVAEYLFDHVLILLGWWGVDEFERKYEVRSDDASTGTHTHTHFTHTRII